jgi:chromosomal replication initiation ATPase DnaA
MGRADFIESAANADTAATVCDPARWPEGRLALVGPAGAGKTHLVHALMAETGAARVPARDLDEAAVPALVAAGPVAVEDVDGDGGLGLAAEKALFHLLNLARAEGAPVVLTGRAAPARWPVALPDLASRLAAIAPVSLAPPDDALLTALIAKLLADRQLTHEAGLPAYLARRIERSCAAALDVVERLDRASYVERRNLTRRLAAAVLDDTGLDGLS